MARKLVLIDGHSLVYRAYHALPPLSTSSGQPTNAVFGLAQMLMGLLDQEKPDAVLVAFDTAALTRRHEEHDQYKANRPPMPDDLVSQEGLIRELVEAMGLAQAETPGFEADDIIGTLAHRARAEGYEVLAVTGDRDLLQVVQPGVSVLATLKGIKETKTYDEAAVREEYGVEPSQFADMKGLAGDTSDNIPGVPGVGAKTAQKLVQEFGSIEALYERLDEVKGKLAQTLRDNEQQARMSKSLAVIDLDAPVELSLEQLHWGGMRAEALRRLLGRLEFTSLLERIPGAAETHSAEIAIVQGESEIAEACRRLREAADEGLWVVLVKLGERPVGLGAGVHGALYSEMAGTATSPPAPLHSWRGENDSGVAPRPPSPLDGEGAGGEVCSQGGDVSYFIEIAEDQPADGGLFAAVSERRVPQPVAELLADASVPKCGIGLKDIAASLRALDVELEGFGFDAGIASYLLAPHRNDHSLGFLAAQYLGRSIPAPDVHGPDDTPGPAHFAAVSLDVLRELRGPLQRDLDGAGLRSLFDGLEMPLVGVLNDMERNGIAVDTGLLRGLGAELEKAVGYLRERIWELAGQEFNIDSPLQLSGILFDKLHLPRGRRTKTGWSTNADVLEALAGEYEIVAKVLEYREYSKLRSTYVDGLLREVNPKTGRVHTTFEQTTAATGRLSSRAPNLQNIPARKEIGREIRACFIAASPETLLIAADYSQIELRIMAHYSQDPYLVDAFQAGEDIHQRTASAIFDVPVGEVSYDMRRVAKTVNYAVIYGMGAGALAQQIGRSKEEAQRFIDNYFRRLGGVTGFMNKTVADARLNGYVSTILGRRRPIPDINSSAGNVRAYAERAAANTPLQGSAADIIKAAMVGIARGLPSCCADARMLLQVHDELVFESPATEAQRVGWYVKGVMETAVTLSVPITVDVSIGSNWRDMKSLDEPA